MHNSKNITFDWQPNSTKHICAVIAVVTSASYPIPFYKTASRVRKKMYQNSKVQLNKERKREINNELTT